MSWSDVKDTLSCLTVCILQTRILEWVAFPSPEDLPNPGIKPKCPTLQVDSLPAEPQGKPNNTGVCSLSLLQWIFPAQEFYQGPLHCRKILYQLSSQGSPWAINVMMSWWTLSVMMNFKTTHIFIQWQYYVCVC